MQHKDVKRQGQQADNNAAQRPLHGSRCGSIPSCSLRGIPSFAVALRPLSFCPFPFALLSFALFPLPFCPFPFARLSFALLSFALCPFRRRSFLQFQSGIWVSAQGGKRTRPGRQQGSPPASSWLSLWHYSIVFSPGFMLWA